MNAQTEQLQSQINDLVRQIDLEEKRAKYLLAKRTASDVQGAGAIKRRGIP